MSEQNVIKRLDNYTNEELIQLTSEDIQRLIDIECMYAGVQFEEFMPPAIPMPDIPARNVQVYEFGPIKLSDPEEANQLKALINTLKSRVRDDYDYHVGSSFRYLKEINTEEEYEPNTTMYYSYDEYIRVKGILEMRHKLQNDNDDIVAEYEERMEKYNDVANEVRSRYYKAQNQANLLEQAQAMYNKYLDLSNGQKEIAENFFKQSTYGHLFDQLKK